MIPAPPPAPPRVEDGLARVRAGLEARALRIEGRIGRELASCVARPGKMLRARFCLLLGAALGVEERRAEAVARAVELVHDASLLHDDCVDGASLRRGRPTPNAVYGATTALLLGDLAFSQAIEEALEASPGSAGALAAAVREMTVGELQEEFLKGCTELSLEAYFGIASRKTGALFEWAGTVLSGLSPLPHERADPPRLACGAGILLQIVDDVLDVAAPERVSGKDAGQDLRNRRLTLPCLYALADPAGRERFLKLWQAGAADPAAARELAAFLAAGGWLERARGAGRELVRSTQALARGLPRRAEAGALTAFVEAMAGREF